MKKITKLEDRCLKDVVGGVALSPFQLFLRPRERFGFGAVREFFRNLLGPGEPPLSKS